MKGVPNYGFQVFNRQQSVIKNVFEGNFELRQAISIEGPLALSGVT